MASHRVVILDLFSWWFFSDGIMGWNSLQNPPFGRVFFSTFSRHRRVASQIQKILEFDPKTSKKDLRFFLKFHSKFQKNNHKVLFSPKFRKFGRLRKNVSSSVFSKKSFEALSKSEALREQIQVGGWKALASENEEKIGTRRAPT